MCWSRDVSAGVAALEFACVALLAWRRAGVDTLVLPLLLTVAGVEALEAVQWEFVEPQLSLRTKGSLPCHSLNRLATIAIALAVSSQPYLWNALLQRSNHNPRLAPLFSFSKAASLVLLLCFYASLAAGELWGFHTASYECSNDKQALNGLFGPGSCAYRGRHGHLQWRFGMSLHELAPNAFPYFLLVALPLLWHRPVWAAVVPGALVLSVWALLLVLLQGNLGEAASVWCFSGVLLHAYYLALPWFWKGGSPTGEAGTAGPSGSKQVQRALKEE